jgi:hypothetical protein
MLDDEPSCSGPLLGPSESMWDGTLGTNPRQQPPNASQVSRCWVIRIFLVHDEFTEYSIQEPSTLAQNRWVLSCGDWVLFVELIEVRLLGVAPDSRIKSFGEFHSGV